MKKYLLLVLMLTLSSVAVAQEELEPFMEEIYFLNKDGERIEGSVTREEKFIYLVIESTNAIGEKVVITMDEDEEYFYKGEFLAAGSSIKIPIKNDIQKVKLYIYNPYKKKHVKRRKESLGYEDAMDAAQE